VVAEAGCEGEEEQAGEGESRTGEAVVMGIIVGRGEAGNDAKTPVVGLGKKRSGEDQRAEKAQGDAGHEKAQEGTTGKRAGNGIDGCHPQFRAPYPRLAKQASTKRVTGQTAFQNRRGILTGLTRLTRFSNADWTGGT